MKVNKRLAFPGAISLCQSPSLRPASIQLTALVYAIPYLSQYSSFSVTPDILHHLLSFSIPSLDIKIIDLSSPYPSLSSPSLCFCLFSVPPPHPLLPRLFKRSFIFSSSSSPLFAGILLFDTAFTGPSLMNIAKATFPPKSALCSNTDRLPLLLVLPLNDVFALCSFSFYTFFSYSSFFFFLIPYVFLFFLIIIFIQISLTLLSSLPFPLPLSLSPFPLYFSPPLSLTCFDLFAHFLSPIPCFSSSPSSSLSLYLSPPPPSFPHSNFFFPLFLLPSLPSSPFPTVLFSFLHASLLSPFPPIILFSLPFTLFRCSPFIIRRVSLQPAHGHSGAAVTSPLLPPHPLTLPPHSLPDKLSPFPPFPTSSIPSSSSKFSLFPTPYHPFATIPSYLPPSLHDYLSPFPPFPDYLNPPPSSRLTPFLLPLPDFTSIAPCPTCPSPSLPWTPKAHIKPLLACLKTPGENRLPVTVNGRERNLLLA
ncbi:hypothetical protein C7M84_007649, partial [Penaeus vannamei]